MYDYKHVGEMDKADPNIYMRVASQSLWFWMGCRKLFLWLLELSVISGFLHRSTEV
jgi:hypothetical protein